ncbi:MAG: outer membrane beta-barrel protein, partial [bacterium]
MGLLINAASREVVEVQHMRYGKSREILNVAVAALSVFLFLATLPQAFGQQAPPGRRGPDSLIQLNPVGEMRSRALELHPGLDYQPTYDDDIFKERTDLLFLATPPQAFGQQAPPERRDPDSLFQLTPEGEMRFGALELHPGLAYQLTYDDNIFKERTDKVDDLISKITPSISLRLPLAGRRHEINLYSEARFFAFEDRHNENHQDYLGKGDFIFRFGRVAELNTGASFETTQDPSSSEQQSVTGARTPRTQLRGSAKGTWFISPKTRLSLSGDYIEDRFRQPARDRLEKNTTGAT